MASSELAQLFRKIVTLLLRAPELDDALYPVLKAIRAILPESTIGLYRYWPSVEELEVIAVIPAEETSSLVGTRLSLEGWRPGEAVRTREAIHLPSVRLKPDAPAVDLLCAPVCGVDQDVLGVLQAASPQPKTFSSEDLDILMAVASLIGLAEENVRRGEALEAATISRLYTEHIAAMADMTSHITHFIVNAMGAIRLAVEVMRRKYTKGSLDDSELDGIDRNAEQTIALLRRIRRPFDKIDTMPVRLGPILDSALEKLVPPDVVLVRQGLFDLPNVMATNNLSEVFHHLIGNAIDAMSEADLKRLIVLTRRSDKAHVEVIIEDSGSGIPPHRREDLFRLGPTEKREGLGYGLWWSSLYLARIGGALKLDDENIAQGARFVVRLPTAD